VVHPTGGETNSTTGNAGGGNDKRQVSRSTRGIRTDSADDSIYLTNVTITENSAGHGGGIAINTPRRLNISDSRIEHNTARWGGAFYALNEVVVGFVTLRAELHNNSALFAGDCLALESCLSETCELNNFPSMCTSAPNTQSYGINGIATSMYLFYSSSSQSIQSLSLILTNTMMMMMMMMITIE